MSCVAGSRPSSTPPSSEGSVLPDSTGYETRRDVSTVPTTLSTWGFPLRCKNWLDSWGVETSRVRLSGTDDQKRVQSAAGVTTGSPDRRDNPLDQSCARVRRKRPLRLPNQGGLT